jgi:hypothetical protein
VCAVRTGWRWSGQDIGLSAGGRAQAVDAALVFDWRRGGAGGGVRECLLAEEVFATDAADGLGEDGGANADDQAGGDDGRRGATGNVELQWEVLRFVIAREWNIIQAASAKCRCD